MFERILVPLDGSERAEGLLPRLRRLLGRKETDVLLLRVVGLPRSVEADAGIPLEVLWSQAENYLRGVAQRLAEEGIRVRWKAVDGFAADAILEAARKERATLIAMTTHGRSGLARWVFGSVTEKVLRASPVPVLVLPSFVGPEGEAFPAGSRDLPFRKILMPLAAEDLSLEIVPPVGEFAGRFGSEVLALNVCEGPQCAVPVPQMTRAYEQLRSGRVPVQPLLRQGDPAVQILELARESGADLIAKTTHGRAGVSRWVFGSVTEKVLRNARLPILVVRTAGLAAAAGASRKKLKAGA